jgi:hypothetical protein
LQVLIAKYVRGSVIGKLSLSVHGLAVNVVVAVFHDVPMFIVSDLDGVGTALQIYNGIIPTFGAIKTSVDFIPPAIIGQPLTVDTTLIQYGGLAILVDDNIGDKIAILVEFIDIAGIARLIVHWLTILVQ